MLYTFENFITLSKDMKMNADKEWSEFSKILHHGPRKEWKKMMSNYNPALNETSR